MRYKLEEANEALDDATVRPGTVFVLYATGKSREVLNSVLEEHEGGSPNGGLTLGIGTILPQLTAVTAELSSTLQALSTSTGTMDMLLTTHFVDQRMQTRLACELHLRSV